MISIQKVLLSLHPKNDKMESVSINISLPNCGTYSQEELKGILQRFAMYKIRPKTEEIPCCYTEDEVKRLLAKRLKEVNEGKAVLIDNDEVFAEAEMLLI